MDLFSNKVNNISKAYDSNEIDIILEDDHYPISTLNQNSFYVQNTLIFHGESNEKSETIFDFQHSPKTVLNFVFQPDLYHKKVIFKNINFHGFINNGPYIYMLFFTSTTDINNFQIIFDHCTFTDIHGGVLYLKHNGIIQNLSNDLSSHVFFNHCRFIDVDKTILVYHIKDYYNNFKTSNSLLVHYQNSFFESVRNIGTIFSADILFEYCYFRNIYGISEVEAAFLFSSVTGNKITISNSRFEDSIVHWNQPYFIINNNILEYEFIKLKTHINLYIIF
ncbi:hypothetical protein PIROE2DRAFT_13173 [Piromyces sp. E2]|nr:hypothetical protein PIROE2DRAFT_13173 [Piromyces sp. E2]|eukprot:OUM60924.1 hypothetical protein PIROE2DRAFT_13173 [Piromyces sp. E2]